MTMKKLSQLLLKPIASARHAAARCHHRECLRGSRHFHQCTLMGAREQCCCSALVVPKVANVQIRVSCSHTVLKSHQRTMIKSLHSPIHSSCGPISSTQASGRMAASDRTLPGVFFLCQFAGYHQNHPCSLLPPLLVPVRDALLEVFVGRQRCAAHLALTPRELGVPDVQPARKQGRSHAGTLHQL